MNIAIDCGLGLSWRAALIAGRLGIFLAQAPTRSPDRATYFP